MQVYSIEEIIDNIREDYPSIDFAERELSVKRWIEEALKNIPGRHSSNWYYNGGISILIQNGIGQLPSSLERLLNVYVHSGDTYIPMPYKQVGDKIQVAQSCKEVFLNFYGTSGEVCAYSLVQKNYAALYAVEKLLKDDIYRGAGDVNFYKLIVADKDSALRVAGKETLPSWDEIANAIYAKNYGKFSPNANHPRYTFS